MNFAYEIQVQILWFRLLRKKEVRFLQSHLHIAEPRVHHLHSAAEHAEHGIQLHPNEDAEHGIQLHGDEVEDHGSDTLAIGERLLQRPDFKCPTR